MCAVVNRTAKGFVAILPSAMIRPERIAASASVTSGCILRTSSMSFPKLVRTRLRPFKTSPSVRWVGTARKAEVLGHVGRFSAWDPPRRREELSRHAGDRETGNYSVVELMKISVNRRSYVCSIQAGTCSCQQLAQQRRPRKTGDRTKSGAA